MKKMYDKKEKRRKKVLGKPVISNYFNQPTKMKLIEIINSVEALNKL